MRLLNRRRPDCLDFCRRVEREVVRQRSDRTAALRGVTLAENGELRRRDLQAIVAELVGLPGGISFGITEEWRGSITFMHVLFIAALRFNSNSDPLAGGIAHGAERDRGRGHVGVVADISQRDGA